MAISRVHTWSAGEVLLASDLNSEFSNILNNGSDLVSPFTKAISLGGFALNFDAANTIAATGTTSGVILTGGTLREPTEDTLTAFATGGQTNATALSAAKKYHRITTCATAADSVKLPTSTAGQVHYIRNDGAANAKVYGTSPDTINSVATATGVTLPAGGAAWYVCTTAGNWTATLSGGTNLTYDGTTFTANAKALFGTTTDRTGQVGIDHNGAAAYALALHNTDTGSSSQYSIRFTRGAGVTEVGSITTTDTAMTVTATTLAGTLSTAAQPNVTSLGTLSSLTVSGTTAAPITQNSKSAAYTTVIGDAGKHILHPAADNNARTFTIDSNANVAYVIGTTITFVNQINTVTIAITSDTLTLAAVGSTGSRTLAANGIATALKVGATSWIISGTGLS